MTPPPIAVTGATGGIGSRVARRLADRGVTQRLVVRDPSRLPDLPGAEVATFGGYDDPDGLTEALRGAEVVLLVSAKEDADRMGLHRAAIDAAMRAGAGRLVYTSFINAAPDATFTFVRDHFQTEELIRASGAEWTFLRDSLYLDFIPFLAGADGAIRGPAGEGRLAPVARDDIADVAVEVLTGEDHAGQIYDLTGPGTCSMSEIAATLGRYAGREVRFVDETVEEAYASRSGYGAQDFEVEGWVTNYLAIAAGELDLVSDGVAQLAGHPPLGLEDYLRAHPESLDALRS